MCHHKTNALKPWCVRFDGDDGDVVEKCGWQKWCGLNSEVDGINTVIIAVLVVVCVLFCYNCHSSRFSLGQIGKSLSYRSILGTKQIQLQRNGTFVQFMSGNKL